MEKGAFYFFRGNFRRQAFPPPHPAACPDPSGFPPPATASCPGVVPARRNEAGRRSLPASGGPEAVPFGHCLLPFAVCWSPSPLCVPSIPARRDSGQASACSLAGLRPPWPGCGSGRGPLPWPAALKAVPFAVAFPQSLPSSALSAISAVKTAQFPCQRHGKKVTNIKVCTWHGWKECEIGHKNR